MCMSIPGPVSGGLHTGLDISWFAQKILDWETGEGVFVCFPLETF